MEALDKADREWNQLNRDATEHAVKGDWASYRDTKSRMAELLYRESRWEQAFLTLLWVCYLDLNGPQNMSGRAPTEAAFWPSAPWAVLKTPLLCLARELRQRLDLQQQPLESLFRRAVAREIQGLALPLSPDDAWAKIGPAVLVAEMEPGYYKGLHYTSYVDEVKGLKRNGDLATAEHLLLRLVEAVEAEAKANCWAVAPWYYEQLAIIYRKLKDVPKETAILTRYIEQLKAPWVHSPVSNLPGRLEDRLMRLLAKQSKTGIIPV